MFHELKNNPAWQPRATLATLRKRGALLASIRQFFAERHILEVETPLLSQASVTDPHIHSIPAHFKQWGTENTELRYLQTSPEYAMKRLLAAGYGPLYQITKAFRQGEVGRLHNPEFTMLEWYRIGFDHHDLMNEVAEFLSVLLPTSATPTRSSYSELFMRYLSINPHTTSKEALMQLALERGIETQGFANETMAFWLDLLFSHCIEPYLGQECPLFIYDFPLSHAALARIREEQGCKVASRFELYYRGIELANGFHELQDAEEQRLRFANDLKQRKEPVQLDERFLAALEHGLPDCAGVALGIDRLCMLALEQETIAHVLSFDFTQA